MSRRRRGAADDLEIEFEGFERVGEVEAADVSFGRGPFGHRPTTGGGRRWPIAVAAVGALAAAVWFLSTRGGHAATDASTRDGSASTVARSPSASPPASKPAPTSDASTVTTVEGRGSATIVTSSVGVAPLMGTPTDRTLHFTDQGASTTFALDLDSGELRELPVKAGLSQAVVTPGRVVGITYDGRLAIIGNDGSIEVGSPAVGVAAVGDGSVWVAVPDDGRLRLNHLIPASDLVTESRMTPGPTLALAGTDAKRNPVVLGADGRPYAVIGDGAAELLSSGSMASHAFGAGSPVVAGAYGDLTCSVRMVCADVFHAATGQSFELGSTDASARSYSFSPDGRRVAVVELARHTIDVYDFSGRPPFGLDVGNAGIAQVPSWSPDGRYIFTYVDREVHWGDVSTGHTGSFQLTRPGVAFVLVGVE
jgi:hypothetical protein